MVLLLEACNEGGGRVKIKLLPNFGNTWRYVTSFVLWPLYPKGKGDGGCNCAGWMEG
jgi:hypothetical protein